MTSGGEESVEFRSCTFDRRDTRSCSDSPTRCAGLAVAAARPLLPSPPNPASSTSSSPPPPPPPLCRLSTVCELILPPSLPDIDPGQHHPSLSELTPARVTGHDQSPEIGEPQRVPQGRYHRVDRIKRADVRRRGAGVSVGGVAPQYKAVIVNFILPPSQRIVPGCEFYRPVRGVQ